MKNVNWDALGKQLAEEMMPFYEQLFALSYDDIGNVMGEAIDFDLSNPLIKKTLDGLATKIKDVAGTTRDEVRSLVGQATEEGWSADTLAAKIREHGEVTSKSRALMIARTETATATSAGAVLAFKEAGVTKKQWSAAGDAEDEDCAAIDGEIVDVDEEFSNGVAYPPAHPNCRCSVIPVIE